VQFRLLSSRRHLSRRPAGRGVSHNAPGARPDAGSGSPADGFVQRRIRTPWHHASGVQPRRPSQFCSNAKRWRGNLSQGPTWPVAGFPDSAIGSARNPKTRDEFEGALPEFPVQVWAYGHRIPPVTSAPFGTPISSRSSLKQTQQPPSAPKAPAAHPQVRVPRTRNPERTGRRRNRACFGGEGGTDQPGPGIPPTTARLGRRPDGFRHSVRQGRGPPSTSRRGFSRNPPETRSRGVPSSQHPAVAPTRGCWSPCPTKRALCQCAFFLPRSNPRRGLPVSRPTERTSTDPGAPIRCRWYKRAVAFAVVDELPPNPCA